MKKTLCNSWAFLIIPFISILVIFLLVFLLSDSPGRTLYFFFVGPFSSVLRFGNMLNSAIPLIFGALGITITMKAGNLNLGGEGQIYLGGCAAAVVLLSSSTFPDFVVMIFAAFAAVAVGGFMGSVSGLLRKKFGASDLITSFLLSASLIPVGDYLIFAVLRSPDVNLLASDRFSSGRVLFSLLPPSSLSVSILFALALIVIFHFLIHRTVAGYRFRISGSSPDLALIGGIDPNKRFVPAMAVSGGFAGLTGFFAVAGTYGMCYQGFSGGLGWNAIAMALIAANEPLLLIPVVFVFASINAGASAVMLQAGFGFETTAFIQAAVLLLAALPFGIRYLKGRGI